MVSLGMALVLVIALLAVGFYDVYVSHFPEQGPTVSAILQGWASRFPMLTLLIGVILGHLFWPKGPER